MYKHRLLATRHAIPPTMMNPLQDDYEQYPISMRASTPALAAIYKRGAEQGVYDLSVQEQFWTALQPYLLSKGYRLRPRYAPGWEPFWVGTDINPYLFEEHVASFLPRVIDAQRESDGKVVAIKWVPHAEHTRDELNVMRFLSSDPLHDDPDNHCNPLIDVLTHPTDPNGIFIVTPWLSGFIYVRIETVAEALDMMLQLTEGIAFMHRNNVAHRDCTGLNIMQDVSACFAGIRTHPIRTVYTIDLKTRLQPDRAAPRKYFFIDFGVSSKFDGPGPHLVTGVICRDASAPELSPTTPYDPFQLDIYLLGNHFLTQFVNKYSNLEFLRPLFAEMTQPQPSDRPTAQQALERLKDIAQQCTGIQKRWRLRERDEAWPDALFDDAGCLLQEAFFQVRSILS